MDERRSVWVVRWQLDVEEEDPIFVRSIFWPMNQDREQILANKNLALTKDIQPFTEKSESVDFST